MIKKFGIIGFGNIGKRHAHFIAQASNAELVAIYDNDKERLYEAEAMYKSSKIYHDEDEFFKDKNIEIINICTPNYLHCEHTIKAVEHHHVVCEKPMALSSIECQQMIDASLRFGNKIFIVKQNRYNTPVEKIKSLLTEGYLGKPVQASIICQWNRNQKYYNQNPWRGNKTKDGGCLYTQFSHFVDILYYFLGACTPVFGEIKNTLHPYIDTEDQGVFLMHNEDGCQINFTYSVNAYASNMEGSFTLICEKGAIKIGGKYLNELSYANVENLNIPYLIDNSKNNEYTSGYQGSMSHHDKVIKNVLDTLNGRDVMKTSATEGMQVVKMIDEMYKVASLKKV